MKKTSLITLLVSIGLLLTSCKKSKEEQPSPANEKFKMNISIENLPGQNTVLDGLSAIVSIKSATGQLVVENQAIPLSYSGKYVSDVIELPKGNYQLVKLILQRQGNSVFASPYAGSNMAQHVTKPLATTINLSKTELTLAMEVLAVSNYKAEDFGYVDGTFNLPPPIDNIEDFLLDLKPIFRVGKIVYDSVPAVLNLTTYPINGNPTTQIHYISAGGQKLNLSKKVAKYKLSVSKWGMDDEIELLPSDMKEDVTLYIGGSTDVAKKIKTESTYLLVGNSWVPSKRKEYSYNAHGKVSKIMHFRKAGDGSNISDGVEELIYNGSKVSEIHLTDSFDDKTTYFWYKPNGNLERMREINLEGSITAEVNYTALPDKRGITNNYRVSATYQSTYHYYKRYINAEMIGANAFMYTNSTSHGDNEATINTYDFNINPHAHLDLPNFWLSNLSKHNRLTKSSRYEINIPKYDAYEFNYVYDAEGFPKEVITKYCLSNTNTKSHTTKTVFTY